MKSPNLRKEQAQQPALPAKIRPELNIEKWSIWQPANSRSRPQARILEREIPLVDGKRVVAKLEVGFTNKGGLTTEDQKVYYALIKHWEERGRSDSFTPFSLRRVAGILRRRWSPKTKNSITQSLLRLRGVLFTWEQAYFDGSTGRRLDLLDTFTILSDLKIVRTRDEGTVNKEVGYFRFHEAILRNLRADHTKPVLLDIVLSFKSEIAQILYTHLDLILSDKASYERRSRELFENLGLDGATYHKPSKRKEKLELAVRELQGQEVTTGRITTAKLEQTKDGEDFKLVVRKGSKAKKAVAPEDAGQPPTNVIPMAIPGPDGEQVRDESPAQDEKCDVSLELLRHFHRVFDGAEHAFPTGKALDQAENLIARHGFEKARHVVDFAHQEAPKTNHKIATFGGIMQYETRALWDFDLERHRREQRQRADAEEAAKQHRHAKEKANEDAAEAAFNAHWETLSPDERDAFQTEAFARAESYGLGYAVNLYRQLADKGGASARMYRKIMLLAHFTRNRSNSAQEGATRAGGEREGRRAAAREAL